MALAELELPDLSVAVYGEIGDRPHFYCCSKKIKNVICPLFGFLAKSLNSVYTFQSDKNPEHKKIITIERSLLPCAKY